MEYVECPACSSVARRMPVLSDVNPKDNFYQCDRCHAVSHMPKDMSAPPMRFTGDQWRPPAQRL